MPELNNRRVLLPRGKVLGGSSSINGLIYIRGQKQDFDLWQQLGNTGRSYDDVLPYFRKSEDQEQGANDITATAVGSPFPTCARIIHCTTHSSMARRRLATSSIPTSTVPSRKA